MPETSDDEANLALRAASEGSMIHFVIQHIDNT